MITYTKLKTDAWGVRGEGPAPKIGSSVTVAKKSGETKQETIAKVISAGDGVWIAAVGTPGATHTNARYRGRSTGCSCGSREDSNGQLIKPERACRQCRYDDE